MKNVFTLSLVFLCLFSKAQNRSLYFDGTDDYAQAAANPNNTNFGAAITLEAWINTADASLANQTIVSRGDVNSYSLYLTSNKLNFTIGWYGFVQVPYTFNNSWHHVAGVYNGSSMQLYIDGNAVGTPASFSGAVAVDNTYPLTVGIYPPVIASKFKGMIDELRVWNVARTQLEIQAAKGKELQTASNPALKVYYRFNQGTANANNTGVNVLTDAVGTSNGSMLNFTLNGATSNWVGGVPSLIGLPISLQSFTAKKLSVSVNLTWTATSDATISSYAIERSNDERTFIQIGEVSSNSNGNYSFTDANPANGINYYRLKTITTIGKTEYSKVLAIKMNSGTTLEVFPNPAINLVQVSLPNKGEKLITIHDVSGIIVNTVPVSNASLLQSVDVSGLGRGSYYLTVGEQTVQFIKQ